MSYAGAGVRWNHSAASLCGRIRHRKLHVRELPPGGGQRYLAICRAAAAEGENFRLSTGLARSAPHSDSATTLPGEPQTDVLLPRAADFKAQRARAGKAETLIHTQFTSALCSLSLKTILMHFWRF
jgi:hypothetical protein